MARQPQQVDQDRRPKSGGRPVDLSSDTVPSDRPIDTKDDMLDGDEAILKQLSDRLNYAWMYWQTTFEASREDVSFMYDEQWPDYAMKGRENRPQLTMNMLPQYAQQVVNAARRSRFAIEVRQMSGKNDPIIDVTGQNKYSRSQIMEGLIRDIEDRSKAHDAYCRACQHQVEGGFGWLFVKTAENYDDPFDIELCIEHVTDRYAVLVDPDARREDLSDATWIAKSMDIPKKEFEERWPDIPMTTWDPGVSNRRRQDDGAYSRGDNEHLRVSDYWWKEPMMRTAVEFVRQYSEKDTRVQRLVMWEDEHGDVFDELQEEGFVERNRKEVQAYKVKYARCIYDHILDGPHDWPSRHLPGVMVRGREINMDSKNMLIGMFRYVHDAQRMLNFWMSAGTEKIALVPRQPYIAAVEQIANQEDQWENMYTANSPVLLYNHLEGVPPPQRQPTTALAQGELQMLGQSRALLQDTVGLHDAALGRRTNEVSGVAMQERQERGDLGTFDFMDNLGKAIRRTGEILVDMIPRCYTTDFVRRVILDDDSEIQVDLNAIVRDEESGRDIRVFSLDYARYACRVDIGPASKTQREEFNKMMIEWGRSDPEGFAVFRDLIVSNMDVPQGKIIARRMKALVPRNLLSPEEREQVPPPEPTPQEQVAQMQVQADMKQAEADVVKAEADIVKAQASVQSSQFKAMSDEARLQFEEEKGLNRAEAEADNDDGVDEAQIETIVKREVAKALAQQA